MTTHSMDLAPRDGTMVWLLVDYTNDANAAQIKAASDAGHIWPWTPLADAPRAWTIGFNNLENTDEDRWQFVGWCWQQDHFTDGQGTPVAWKPIGFKLEQS